MVQKKQMYETLGYETARLLVSSANYIYRLSRDVGYRSTCMRSNLNVVIIIVVDTPTT